MERVAGLLGEVLAVEALDEPVGADHVAGVEGQDGGEAPQLLAPEVHDRPVVRHHLQRAEKADLHGREARRKRSLREPPADPPAGKLELSHIWIHPRR